MSTTKMIKTGLISIFFLIRVTDIAHAALLVENLTQNIGGGVSVSSNQYVGSQFTTSTNAYKLGRVTLDIAGGSGSGGFFVSIYGSGNTDETFTNGQPAVFLETLTGETNPSAAQEYTYTSSGLSLSTNTSYWVVAGVSSGSAQYEWNYSGNRVVTGQNGASIRHYIKSDDGGSTWNADTNFYNSEPQKMSISILANFWLGIETADNKINGVVYASEGFTNRVEIYSTDSIFSNNWTVAVSNLLPVSTNPATWDIKSASGGFFQAGNMDVDSDSDQVPDAREIIVHKTDPNDNDSD